MKRYLITGATGYIGSMLVRYIAEQDKEAQIAALVRNRKKAEEMLPAGVRMYTVDLRDRAEVKKLEIPCDYLIHCASVTKSAEMVSHPVEVTESIVNVTQNVLELARQCNVQSMVYLSSMEVYGSMDCPDGRRITEQEAAHGAVEILNLRSCYPLGKRMAENLCYSYFKEYAVPVKIARLAQTFGHGILPSDNRVFAQFARAVKNGADIILHTDGNSTGNYCAIDDTIEGILTILECGENGEAYNVVNEENTMTIRQMAELAASQVAEGKTGVRFDISRDKYYGYAPDTGLRLSGEKLRRLGWNPKKKLVDMYREMLEDID